MADKILNDLIHSINNFVGSFKLEPYNFLLENDLQCALFAELRADINQFVTVAGVEDESYHLNLINSEYLDRFDICCLNPEKIKKLNAADSKHNDGHLYQLPVLLAIELKFIWGNQRRSFDIFTQNVEKIAKSKYRERIDEWISMCFVQKQSSVEWQIDNSNENYNVDNVDEISSINHISLHQSLPT